MRAHARIVAVCDAAGRTRLPTLRSEVPLVLRETPEGVYLVGGAGGPLGGDELDLDVDIGDGAQLALRSAAAVLAQPGPNGGVSRQRTRVRLGPHATFVLRPEPLVSVARSEHHVHTEVTLHGSSTVVLLEELVLGRHAEPPGRVRSRIRVVRDGDAVLTHELDVGGDAPGWSSSAVLGAARAMVQQIVIGPDAPGAASSRRDDDRGVYTAWLPVTDGVAVLLSLGPTLLDARAGADSLATASRSGAPWR